MNQERELEALEAELAEQDRALSEAVLEGSRRRAPRALLSELEEIVLPSPEAGSVLLGAIRA